MKRILLLLLLAVSIGASAETTIFDRIKRTRPDFAEIKKQINDRTSDYYYPRLMEEYLRNDTLMKLDKYRYLYLGYSLQEDYNPYREPAFTNLTANTVTPANMTSAQCDTIIHYANLALEDNPFDLQQMAVLISALRQRGRTGLADIWQYKFNYILMAIVSTGTGLDEENAWYVIEPQHEYILLNMMGYTVTNHLFYEPAFEYLTVVDARGAHADGFYFNIKHLLEEYYRKFPDDPNS
ncbi:MAG: DUF4919 domain-containing protein [Paramuribaculum sp.]|nr:DUF4919 domain-containing protein [Paramuribaculum sp.]